MKFHALKSNHDGVSKLSFRTYENVHNCVIKPAREINSTPRKSIVLSNIAVHYDFKHHILIY